MWFRCGQADAGKRGKVYSDPSLTPFLLTPFSVAFLIRPLASRPHLCHIQTMRLTSEQQRAILRIARRHVGVQATVRVYGSRLQNDLRGGDVDLMIEGQQRLAPLTRAALQLDLQEALQLPVDILYHQVDQPLSPFQVIAKAASQPLEIP